MNQLFPKFKWISLTVIFLSAAWIFLSAYLIPTQAPTTISIPQIGFFAPDFNLPSLQNEQHHLQNDPSRVILVNFFASWCPPCKLEMPAMQKIYDEYQSSGLEIYAITNMQQDNLTDIQLMIQSSGATFPILLDQNGTLYNEYAIQALPTTFLIDSEGRIQKIFYGGPLTESLLITEIERLLKEN
jgi:peroxiredoxin